MPVPATRTPTLSVNNQILSSVAHTDQFRELFYQLKVWLVASGGTILRSNGGGTASAADNIPNAAAVTVGATGTGAWFVVEFAVNTVSDSVHRKLVYVNAPSNPRRAIEIIEGPGAWTGGTTSALPTNSDGLITAAVQYDLHPSASAVNLRWSSSRTTSPNRPAWFLVKEEGVSEAGFIWLVLSNTGDNGSGAERWASFMTTAAIGTQMNAAAYWKGFTASGSAEELTVAASNIWILGANWANGLSSGALANPDIIRVGQAASGGRQLGTFVDVYGLPPLFPFGLIVDSSESAQNPRRVSFGNGSITSFSLYWPNGTLVL